jgi:transcriptional regulator of acetoin/glycerol metabolism
MTSELANLIKALQVLADLPPVERARRCPDLIDEAKAALAHERGAAIAEAVDSGHWTQARIARELGKSRQKIHDMLANYREQTRTTTPQEG